MQRVVGPRAFPFFRLSILNLGVPDTYRTVNPVQYRRVRSAIGYETAEILELVPIGNTLYVNLAIITVTKCSYPGSCRNRLHVPTAVTRPPAPRALFVGERH